MTKKNPNYERMKKMKGKELNHFVSGFVDGEGTFCVSIAKLPTTSLQKGWKWIFNPLFQVYQHEDNLWFLEFLRDEVFKTGRIHRKSSPNQVFTFSIENRKTLQEKVVPFFRKYRLATKDKDFQIWSSVINSIYNKEHLKEKGFRKIVDIVFTMNKNGKQRKYSKQDIFRDISDQFNK